MINEAVHPQKENKMDTIKVIFDGDTYKVTRKNGFDFFSKLFPQGIILTTRSDGMVGLSVPAREGENDGKGKPASE